MVPSSFRHHSPSFSVTMKAVWLLVCILGLTAAERYHKRVGIPTATKIRLQESSMRIAGGIGSYQGEHPYFAGLLITLKSGEVSVCGGALISNVNVVTIGQCWYDGESMGKTMEVVLGSNRLNYGGLRNYALWTILHPQYNPDWLVNDVAVARIPSVKSNISDYISPIPLPSFYFSESLDGYLAQIIGLGKTSPGGPYNMSSSLRDVYVTVMSNADCDPYYGSYVKEFGQFMCTSGAKSKGACAGDYGGPLVLSRYSSGQDMLVGLVSLTYRGIGCDAGYPTGYTRITSHRRWLNNFL